MQKKSGFASRFWRSTGYCMVLFLCLLSVRPLPSSAQNSERLLDKKITIALEKESLIASIIKIESAAKIRIFYDANSIKSVQQTYTNQFNQQTIANILKALLQGTSIIYRESKSGIILKEKTADQQLTNADTPDVSARQEGNSILKGYIVEFESSQPLPGASVYISELHKAVQTDEKGYYRFSSLPAGKYTLQVSYIGYKKESISVTVQSGREEAYDVKLQGASALKEVVINSMGRKRTPVAHASDKAVLQEIKNAQSVVSGISSQQISMSADRNVAEIVKKISGVTINDDKFIIIRGMNERYNLTYLNGNIAPSTELYSRAFSLDLLPSRIVDRILVYKSPAPDLMGDMTGGAVKIYTKDAVYVKHFDIELQLGYRPHTTFNDKFLTYQGSHTDFMGFDNSVRKLPAVVPGYGDFTNASISQQSYAEHFSPYLQYGYKTGLPLMQLTANYYNAFKIAGKNLSMLSSLSYKNESQQYEIDRTRGQAGFNGSRAHATSHETQSTQTAQITLLQNFTYHLKDSSSITFKNFFLQQGQSGTVLRTTKSNQLLTTDTRTDLSSLAGLSWRDESAGYNPYERNIILSYTQRFLYSGNLAGNHYLQQGKGQLEWNLGYTYSRQQLPDQRVIRLSKNRGNDIGYVHLPADADLNWMAAFRHVVQPDEETSENSVDRGIISRTWVRNSENLYNASVDYTWKLHAWATFKAGTYQQWKQRILFRRAYRLNEGDLNSVGYPENRYAPIGQGMPFMDMSKVLFLQQDLGKVWSTDYLKDDGTALKVFDVTNGSDAYTATEQLNAGYAALSLQPFHGKLDIYGGLRIEYDRQKVAGAIPAAYGGGVNRPVLADNKTTSLLPSVNIGYRPAEQVVIRLGYGKTVNRPEFRELSPYTELDYLNNQYIQGNYNLTSAKVTNYDARIELYPKDNKYSETFSIGVFYKDLQNPIERTISQSLFNNSPVIISFANADKATVKGLEIDLRKNLGFIPFNLFRNLSVIGNLTLIQSTVNKTLDTTIIKNPDPKANPHYTRQLQGQAPYMVNLGLYYDNAGSGTKLALSWNLLGPRIYAAANGLPATKGSGAITNTPGDLGSTIELERQTLDAALTQRIMKRLQLKLSVQNLLNQPIKMAEDENFSYKYEKAQEDGMELRGDMINSEYRTDRHFILSLMYAF